MNQIDLPVFELTALPYYGWMPENRATRRSFGGGIQIPKAAKDNATKKRRKANKAAHKQRMKNK